MLPRLERGGERSARGSGKGHGRRERLPPSGEPSPRRDRRRLRLVERVQLRWRHSLREDRTVGGGGEIDMDRAQTLCIAKPRHRMALGELACVTALGLRCEPAENFHDRLSRFLVRHTYETCSKDYCRRQDGPPLRRTSTRLTALQNRSSETEIWKNSGRSKNLYDSLLEMSKLIFSESFF